jgi:hypothetical protein
VLLNLLSGPAEDFAFGLEHAADGISDSDPFVDFGDVSDLE